MVLEELKDYWRDVCLSHKDVLDFQVGNDYDAATTTNKYPLCFYELPYTIDYNLDKAIDTVQFSFNVFLNTKIDNIVDDHQAISICKSIGDAILSKIKAEALGFKINSVNGVSVREYSDDNVAGFRWDLNITLKRDICDADYKQFFN